MVTQGWARNPTLTNESFPQGFSRCCRGKLAPACWDGGLWGPRKLELSVSIFTTLRVRDPAWEGSSPRSRDRETPGDIGQIPGSSHSFEFMSWTLQVYMGQTRPFLMLKYLGWIFVTRNLKEAGEFGVKSSKDCLGRGNSEPRRIGMDMNSLFRKNEMCGSYT